MPAVLEGSDRDDPRRGRCYVRHGNSRRQTGPRCEDLRRDRRSRNDGDVRPEQIGYINAHGTATQANDPMESEAIRIVFGDHTDNIRVSSTKSMHGHTLGAAGAIEGAATVLGLHHGVLPPTA